MKPWIDHQGRLLRLINIYDLLAIVILIIILISGRQAWFRYQLYRHEQEASAEQLLLTEEQNRLVYRQERNEFFLFGSVPDSVVSHLNSGLSITNRFGNPLFEIREIIAVFPVLTPVDRDSQSGWMVAQSDTIQRSILMKIRYYAEEYRTDSVYFNNQRVYPGGHLIFPFPMLDLLGQRVNYNPDWSEIQPIVCLTNLPPTVAHHSIKPGTQIVDQFNRPIAEFQDILSIQPYRYTDKINQKTAHVTSPNFSLTARLRIRLYQLDHQYYCNFSPFSNRLDGYLRLDSTRWLSSHFDLSDPLPLSPSSDSLRCRLIIHQLRADEVDQIKPGQTIYNAVGQAIGTIARIASPPMSDFYHSYIYRTRNCLVHTLDPDWRRISATADIAVTYANGYFYVENILLNPSTTNFIGISLILNGNQQPKKADICFPFQMPTCSESLAIHLYTQETFSLPALLLDPISGSEIIGRIWAKKNKDYLAELELDIRSNGQAYYNDQIIHYTQESPFVIYTKDKLITTSGSFLPHHSAGIEMTVDNAQLPLIRSIIEPYRIDPNKIRIVSTSSIDGKWHVQIKANLYRIGSTWYLHYPDIPIIPGQPAAIRIGQSTISGTILAVNPEL